MLEREGSAPIREAIATLKKIYEESDGVNKQILKEIQGLVNQLSILGADVPEGVDGLLEEEAETENNGSGNNWTENNGSGNNGTENNGSGNNGTGNNGSGNNGTGNNGSGNNGTGNNGSGNNGSTNNGATNNGATNNGATNNGATNNGATNNGATNNGATNNQAGGARRRKIKTRRAKKGRRAVRETQARKYRI
jgi:PPE-repeat protein